MLRKQKLSNGISLATYEMASVKSLQVGITVRGGSLIESAKKKGLAHYMEHMLVQGIPSLPDAQVLSSFVESLSGTYGAYTSALTVHFSLHVPFSHVDDALRIASEVFFTPLFPKEAMEKERHAVINEITQETDSRWFKFNEFFRKTRYTPKSILQQRIGGSIESVNKLTRADLLAYWKAYFLPTNTSLLINGNFNQAQLEKLVKKYFEPIKKSTVSFPGFPTLSPEKDFARKTVAIRQDTTLQAIYIDLVFPSLPLLASPLEHIQQLLSHVILGRLRSSRLFRLLRYEKGYVYNVSTSNSEWPGVGYSSIYSEVSPQYVDQVVEIMTQELQKFLQIGPTKEELTFAKNFMTNQWLMAFDNPGSIANWIEGQLIWRDTILLPEDEIKLLEKITVEDMITFLQTQWDMRKVQLILQGAIEESEKNKEKYTKMLSTLG